MFSPQLNEAKYNLLSADINKCGGKGNAIDVALSRAKIQIYKIKIQTKAGKCLNRHWIIKKRENRPLAGFTVTNMLLCYVPEFTAYYYAICYKL